MTCKTSEKTLQQFIVYCLISKGWVLGHASQYNKDFTLYPEDVINFFRTAHPDQWEKFSRMYPQDTEIKGTKGSRGHHEFRGRHTKFPSNGGGVKEFVEFSMVSP